MVCWSVCLSVCYDREPCKKAGPIEMPFGISTQVGPGNLILDRGPDPNTQRGNFEGEVGLAQDMSGHVLQLIHSLPQRGQHQYGALHMPIEVY